MATGSEGKRATGVEPRLAHRLALGAAWSAVPLVLFGGSVTTLGAGMAVDGWLVPEGHFLPFFPVEKWFRDLPTFVEHTHRLCGILVGICALGAALAALREPGRTGRFVAFLALLAVCGQGALGGLRVLENSPRLAFLHGALAQAVFALLAASALLLSPAWRLAREERRQRTPSVQSPSSRSLVRLAAVASVAVYGQIVLGALVRHALRSGVTPVGASSSGLLVAHALGAAVVLALVGALLARLLASPARETPVLAKAGGRLRALLLVQLLLGGVAWAGYREGPPGAAEWAVSILHVLVGGLLLVQTTQTWLWALRLRPARAGASSDAAPARVLGHPAGGAS